MWREYSNVRCICVVVLLLDGNISMGYDGRIGGGGGGGGEVNNRSLHMTVLGLA